MAVLSQLQKHQQNIRMNFLAGILYEIILGIFIESLGAFVRKTWYKATGTKPYNPKCATKQWGFEHLVDMESFKNRIVGWFVVVPIAILIIYLSFA